MKLVVQALASDFLIMPLCISLAVQAKSRIIVHERDSGLQSRCYACIALSRL